MPVSKHRRKPGRGKSVKHPGRSPRPVRRPILNPMDEAYVRFHELYVVPFHRQFRDDPLDAGSMLQFIADAAFDDLTDEIVPVNKQAIFQEFMAVKDWEDDSPSHETVGSAEAALTSLVEQGMVEVADDQLTVPTRFVPKGAKQRRPSEPAEGTVPE